MIPYNRGHWRRSLDDRYETLPNERGGRALLGAPGETFRRETFRSAQASLASALGGGSAALGEAPNLAPSARTVHGLDPRGSGPLFFMFIRPQPYTCLGIEWLTQGGVVHYFSCL